MFRCTPLCKNQGGCLAVRTFCCLLILSWVAGVVGSSVATAQDTCLHATEPGLVAPNADPVKVINNDA